MTITREQAQQLPEFCAAAAAELSLAGLNQQLIAGLEILELDLAARGVEIMPLGRFDLVAIPRDDAIDVGGRSRHERGNGGASRDPPLRFAERPSVHSRLNIDTRIIQI